MERDYAQDFLTFYHYQFGEGITKVLEECPSVVEKLTSLESLETPNPPIILYINLKHMFDNKTKTPFLHYFSNREKSVAQTYKEAVRQSSLPDRDQTIKRFDAFDRILEAKTRGRLIPELNVE